MDVPGAVSTHVMSVDDGSLPGSLEEQAQMFLEWSSFNLDRYYAKLKDVTVATSFVEVDEPLSLLHALSRKHITEEETRWLKGFSGRLDAAMQSMGGSSCFVKLQRSPKDAVDKPPLREVVRDALRIELAVALNRKSELSQLDLMLALKQSFARALSCRKASQVLEIFGVSNRIVSDLVRFGNLFGRDTKEKLFAVVRLFREIPLHAEIRCFVYHRKLTAASQYFSELFFPQLQGQEAALSGRLFKFIPPHVIDMLPEPEYESFIVDVALLDDGSCVVIELNPFTKVSNSFSFLFLSFYSSVEWGRII